eukprot:351698-Chlamydomonas_euryale.AAC.4
MVAMQTCVYTCMHACMHACTGREWRNSLQGGDDFAFHFHTNSLQGGDDFAFHFHTNTHTHTLRTRLGPPGATAFVATGELPAARLQRTCPPYAPRMASASLPASIAPSSHWVCHVSMGATSAGAAWRASVCVNQVWGRWQREDVAVGACAEWDSALCEAGWDSALCEPGWDSALCEPGWAQVHVLGS